jgi:hypothetical protein
MPDGPRYGDDFYAWIQYQAEVLRTLRVSDGAREMLSDKMTGTLRYDAEESLGKLYAEGRRRAARGLLRHGEPEVADALPQQWPYSLDEICREDWYPASPAP